MCGPPSSRSVNEQEGEEEEELCVVAGSGEGVVFPSGGYLPQHLGCVIFKNGNFLTLQEGEPRCALPSEQEVDQSEVVFQHSVQALGSVNGIIAALGSNEEVSKKFEEMMKVGCDCEDGVVEVDLLGRPAVPGFVASHEHLAHEGLHLTHLNFFPDPERMGSKAAAADLIRRYAEQLRERDMAAGSYDPARNAWVQGYNWDNHAAGFEDVTRAELDALCPDYPLKIYHTSLHRIYFNSKAMERMPHDVFDGMEDPAEGQFLREADGRTLTGVADEHACHLINRNIPHEADYAQKIALAGLRFAAKGVTSVYDAYSWDHFAEELHAALLRHGGEKHPPFPVRVGMYFGEVSRLVPSNVEPSPWLRGLGRKFVLDGGLLIRTGALKEDYHDRPGWRGELRDPEAKRQRIIDFHAQGVQMAIHTNGDAAVDWTLDVLQEAQRQHPRSDARHRLEHVQIISEEQLARMAQMGVMANFFISHVFYFGDRHRLQFFGPRRAHRINPLRSALAHRVQFAVHNDNPVTPLNPLHSMWIASSRITRAGVPLGPDQRITPSQALRAYTIDAAYQAFEDHLKGRLAVGRYADFVVLSHNPLALPVPLLKDIALHMTVQGGHVTYTDHSIPVPAPLSFWARYLQSFQQSHPDFFLSHN